MMEKHGLVYMLNLGRPGTAGGGSCLFLLKVWKSCLQRRHAKQYQHNSFTEAKEKVENEINDVKKSKYVDVDKTEIPPSEYLRNEEQSCENRCYVAKHATQNIDNPNPE